MSETTTLKRPTENMKLAISTAKDARYVPGRRHFFQYRDLGVTEATILRTSPKLSRRCFVPTRYCAT